jgi:hypothetical protein
LRLSLHAVTYVVLPRRLLHTLLTPRTLVRLAQYLIRDSEELTTLYNWHLTMVSLQLNPKQPEKYDGKRDFQVIDNWITSVDSYFALTHAEAPDIYHYLNTILIGEAATWFRFIYRNVDPNTITWQAVRMSIKAPPSVPFSPTLSKILDILSDQMASSQTQRSSRLLSGSRNLTRSSSYNPFLTLRIITASLLKTIIRSPCH